MKMNSTGAIPIAVIVVLMIVAALGGGTLVLILSGSAKLGLLVFFGGVVTGLIILPNLKKIIRWVKDVKKEL